MAFNILSFDGGGIRGVVAARVLENLCHDSGCVAARADLVVGSSVGATTALALALGIPPDRLVAGFANHVASIFRPSRRRGFFGAVYRTADQRAGHLAALTELGVQSPETVTLAGLGKRALITTFQLNGLHRLRPGDAPAWRAKLYHNAEVDSDGAPNPDLDELMIDVLLRSSAAPIAFPVYQGFADGGLVALNPAMCAVAHALNSNTGGATVDELRVLSIGTGRGATHSLDVGTANWGLWQWGLHAGRYGDRFIEAFADVPAFQVQQLLGERHLRLNAPIPGDVGVDRPSDVPRCIAAADAFRETAEWAAAVEWVRRQW